MNHYCMAVLAVIALGLAGSQAVAQMGQPATHYQGRWEVQPNGDVMVTWVYRLTQQNYDTWKRANVHMLLARSLDSSRSEVVASTPAVEWNDMDRTLTLRLTAQGATANLGTHWEVKVLPNLTFSSLDKAARTAYFYFVGDSPLGQGMINGQDHIILPEGALNPAWKEHDRKIVYELPLAARAEAQTRTVTSSMPTVFLVLFGVCLAVGLMLFAMSFIPRPPGPQG